MEEYLAGGCQHFDARVFAFSEVSGRSRLPTFGGFHFQGPSWQLSVYIHLLNQAQVKPRFAHLDPDSLYPW
ncbi:hypothetical protein AMECASPLE_026840 [Ameca splendens]|uniref:Uncharacterized protein n=1 Tax=Ameca splendens TaxID=208324 RepID=A0ABV0ZQ65_9TELE